MITLARSYRIPDLTGNGNLLPFSLMWLPLGDHPPEIAAEQVAEWVQRIYALWYPDHLDVAERIATEILDRVSLTTSTDYDNL